MNDNLRILLDGGFSLAEIAEHICFPQRVLRLHRTGQLARMDSATAAVIDEYLGDLVADCRRLAVAGPRVDPAALLACPVLDGYPVTGWDLLRAGHRTALFSLARGADPETALNHYVPGWREQWPQSEWEVVEGPDGHPLIQKRETGT